MEGIQIYACAPFSLKPVGVIANWNEWKQFLLKNEDNITEWRKTKNSELKSKLGCYTPSCFIEQGNRCESNAQPRVNHRGHTPLFSDWDKMGEDKVQQFVSDMMALHDSGQIFVDYLAISCSGNGIHLIYDEFDGHDDWDIIDHHHEVCRLLGGKYDECLDGTVKNFSHLAFAERLSDVKFVDIKGFIC